MILPHYECCSTQGKKDMQILMTSINENEKRNRVFWCLKMHFTNIDYSLFIGFELWNGFKHITCINIAGTSALSVRSHSTFHTISLALWRAALILHTTNSNYTQSTWQFELDLIYVTASRHTLRMFNWIYNRLKAFYLKFIKSNWNVNHSLSNSQMNGKYVGGFTAEIFRKRLQTTFGYRKSLFDFMNY